MTQLLFLVHRYLGIAVGWLMAMWCVSGLVMMYVGYPALGEPERLAHLAPINWRDCCRFVAPGLADSETVSAFRVEMVAGQPIAEIKTEGGAAVRYGLDSGKALYEITPAQAAMVAATYLKIPSSLHADGLIDYDQWTLGEILPIERPLYRFGLGDESGSELYVSRSSGKVVQLTTRRQRFWNWLGAVPHWLYFADLRHHARLWSELVIYSSLIGCFLTVIGIYTGLRQLVRQPGCWSPYQGFKAWHHGTGLLFGLLTFTWVLSGCLSMNPWGLLEGGDTGSEQVRLHGFTPTLQEVRRALQALAAAPPARAVSIEAAPLHGALFFIASDAVGERQRLDASGARAPLDDAERRFIVAAVAGRARSVPSSAAVTDDHATLQLLQQGDNYYFSHDSQSVRLPAYRVTAPDGSACYIDPVSGELITRIGREDRRYRWWHQALHRIDFSPALRARPQWDVVLWLLMLGVTTSCFTGAFIGWRRLMRGR